jgi:hypothetical protein
VLSARRSLWRGVMQASFMNMRAEARRPSFDAADVERLRRLPPAYGRAVPDEVDIATFLVEARAVAARIVENDPDDGRRPYRRALVASLERGIELFEHTDDAFREAYVALEKARLRLDPPVRERAARHAPVLAMVTHALRTYDERMLLDANTWLAGLEVPVALLVAQVVRKENNLAIADDLRCRAFNALRVELRRRSA